MPVTLVIVRSEIALCALTTSPNKYGSKQIYPAVPVTQMSLTAAFSNSVNVSDNTSLFVPHDIKWTDFEFYLNMLILLSCCVSVFKSFQSI